jgi:hypothetical protein
MTQAEGMVFLPFDPAIKDEELRAFFGAGNIFEIKRDDGACEITVCTTLPSDVLELILRTHRNWFSNRKQYDELRQSKFYQKMERQLSAMAPAIHVMRLENELVENGFSYLDKDDNWKQVWFKA